MSYYVVIPAPVRHANIPDGAKLLFGDIAGLAKKEGYCFASNAHLASIAGVSRRTAESYVASLEAAGFIEREMVDSETRRITIAQKSAYPIAENSAGSHEENCDHTNTSLTITTTMASDYFFERGLTRSEADSLAIGFLDYEHKKPLGSGWKRAAATWMNRAIDYGHIKRPAGPFTDEQIRDPQTGNINTAMYRKRNTGWFK